MYNLLHSGRRPNGPRFISFKPKGERCGGRNGYRKVTKAIDRPYSTHEIRLMDFLQLESCLLQNRVNDQPSSLKKLRPPSERFPLILTRLGTRGKLFSRILVDGIMAIFRTQRERWVRVDFHPEMQSPEARQPAYVYEPVEPRLGAKSGAWWHALSVVCSCGMYGDHKTMLWELANGDGELHCNPGLLTNATGRSPQLVQ